MRTIVYKVVRRTPKHYKSAMTKGKYKVYYKIGRLAKAPVGKLFIFKSLKKAKAWVRFVHCEKNLTLVLECSTEDTPKRLRYRALSARTNQIKSFWENLPPVWKTPSITFGVKSLTPIKEI